jgi:hypothetical protein
MCLRILLFKKEKLLTLRLLQYLHAIAALCLGVDCVNDIC